MQLRSKKDFAIVSFVSILILIVIVIIVTVVSTKSEPKIEVTTKKNLKLDKMFTSSASEGK